MNPAIALGSSTLSPIEISSRPAGKGAVTWQSTSREAGEHGQVAVKVIDDRGNELLVVKSLKDLQ
ncbi:MAG TPA: hypothetical protein VNE39_24830 [Planctomycetota bacterium]|nr:hypothetical protein [Planctomycetota bacterium]